MLCIFFSQMSGIFTLYLTGKLRERRCLLKIWSREGENCTDAVVSVQLHSLPTDWEMLLH